MNVLPFPFPFPYQFVQKINYSELYKLFLNMNRLYADFFTFARYLNSSDF